MDEAVKNDFRQNFHVMRKTQMWQMRQEAIYHVSQLRKKAHSPDAHGPGLENASENISNIDDGLHEDLPKEDVSGTRPGLPDGKFSNQKSQFG
jgi:hypothetical protein